ncbi:MAG: DUF4231 domain-containing protein [Acidobacteria bacterium]|nr:DUF4231 domain-containing protein [Acidobacteriota bacterium]
MTNDQKQKLLDWQKNFQLFLRGHYDAAHKCQRMNLCLGIPVVVLSAVVGTSVFSATTSNPSAWAKVLVGCISVFVAILAALQTFLRHSERSEKHRLAGASFAALHKEIDQLLILPPSDDEDLQLTLSSLRTRWDELSKESPTIPVKIWNRHKEMLTKSGVHGDLPN